MLDRVAPPASWQFLEPLSDGILLVDQEGKILYLNPAARALIRLPHPPSSLEALYEAVAPHHTWRHLLSPLAESYLALPSGTVRVQSRPINLADAELFQIVLTPVNSVAQEEDSAGAATLASLGRIVQRLNQTLKLDDILQVILNEAILVTNAAGGMILLAPDAWPGGPPLELARGETMPAAWLRSLPLPDADAIELHLRDHDFLRSALALPISDAAEEVGVISLFSRRHGFRREAVAFLRTATDYAKLALANARRFDEIQRRSSQLSRRAEQMERFVQSSRLFHRNQTVDEVYEELVYAIQEGVGFNVVLLSLIQENDPAYSLHRVAAAGLPIDRLAALQEVAQPWQAVRRLARDEFALGRAHFVPAEAGVDRSNLRLHSIGDLFETDQDDPHAWQNDDLFFIVLRGANREPLGVISLDAPLDGHRPDHNTAKALELFANQAAIAIENIRLYDNTRLFANQLRLIHDVSQAVLRQVAPQAKLALLVEGLQQIGWERVVLTLRDAEMKPLAVVTAGITEEERGRLESNMTPPDVWRARFEDEAFLRFRLGSAYFLPAEDPWAEANLAGGIPDHSLPSTLSNAWHPDDVLLVPLLDQEQRIIALISLDQPRDRERPDPQSLQILELYARFAASVIENSRLYEEAVTRTEELETLYGAINAISGSLEPERVLSALGRHMLRAVGGAGFAVYAVESEELVLMAAGGDAEPPPPGARFSRQAVDWGQSLFVERHTSLLRAAAGTPRLGALANLPEGTYHCILVPILLRDDLYGVAQVAAAHGWSAAGNEIKVLETFVGQAAVALDNARLFEETARRERFFAAMGRVSAAINSTFDLPTVLDVICEESLNLFDVDGVYVWQKQDAQLRGLAAKGDGRAAFLSASLDLEEESALAAAVARTGRSRFVRALDRRDDVRVQLPHAESVRSALAVPLTRADDTIGVMVLIDRQSPFRFGQEDVELATQFGIQAAIAIRNARLVTELRELNEQLDERVAERTQALGEERDRIQLLLRITTELSVSLDQHYVLNRALALINEVARATRGEILLLEVDGQAMVCRAGFGLDQPVPPAGIRLEPDRQGGLPSWVIANREPILIGDTAEDERTAGDSPPRSALAVPLVNGEDVIGVLQLFHKETNAFSARQLELVQAAASQVSNAIYNAQLYVLIRDQTEKLGKMWREEQVEAAKNQAILEGIADGVLFAESSGLVTMANRATSTILGLSRDQLVGRSVRELRGLYGVSGDTWVQAIDTWARRPQEASGQTVLADQFTLDDAIVAVTLSPVLDRGQFIGTVSVFRDITKAVEVDRMKSEFVSTVSHELRTPMTSIKGYADLMLMGVAGQLSDHQQQFLNVIKNNADRLSLLVNDLLDISRFETGKAKLDLRPLDVAEVIEQVVEGHARGRIQHETRDLQLGTTIAGRLPLVNGDQARVTQILTNLVDNAINYTPSGGSVSVAAARENGRVVVSVQDSGIGIAPENQKKIFDRFFRSDDDLVQQVAGTGLGLAIVRTLVEMHGGDLTLDSAPGAGSTFTFSLPVVKAVDEEMG